MQVFETLCRISCVASRRLQGVYFQLGHHTAASLRGLQRSFPFRPRVLASWLRMWRRKLLPRRKLESHHVFFSTCSWRKGQKLSIWREIFPRKNETELRSVDVVENLFIYISDIRTFSWNICNLIFMWTYMCETRRRVTEQGKQWSIKAAWGCMLNNFNVVRKLVDTNRTVRGNIRVLTDIWLGFGWTWR